MNRRSFLKVAGGGVVLGAAGFGGFAATRTPTAALAPWQAAGQGYADARLNALSYAILAPNPHNRQPWIVALDGDDVVSLFFDTDRQLDHTDPFDRQLTIGLGCFLELMTMAAAAQGQTVDLTLFPEGSSEDGLDARPVARAVFRSDASLTPDPLWAQVPNRRSNKEPFDTDRAVAPDALAGLIAAARFGRAGGTLAEAEVAQWRALTEEALRIEIETPLTFRESVDLFRIGKAEVLANPDGIDFSGVTFDILSALGMFTQEAAMQQDSMSYEAGMQAVLENCRTAMGHVWLVTDDNSRVSQIQAGADWLRINLAATAAGLGFQPLSQALQEFPEMAEPYKTVHARLAPEGGTVQMLSRIGYGPDVAPSPRWPLEAKVRAA